MGIISEGDAQADPAKTEVDASIIQELQMDTFATALMNSCKY